jgi:hypothetical protein
MREPSTHFEEEGQTLFYLANSLQNEGSDREKTVWAPILLKDVPDGFGEDEDAVWTVQGRLTGVKFEGDNWQDCIAVDNIVASGTLDEVSGCMVPFEEITGDIPF